MQKAEEQRLKKRRERLKEQDDGGDVTYINIKVSAERGCGNGVVLTFGRISSSTRSSSASTTSIRQISEIASSVVLPYNDQLINISLPNVQYDSVTKSRSVY